MNENLGSAVDPNELKDKLSEETLQEAAEQTQEIVQELQDTQEELTEEQQLAAVKEAQQYVEEDADINLACHAMIVSRQLYWMGRIALQRRLKDLTTTPGVEQALAMNIASHADQMQFTSQQVMAGLAGPVLQFVTAETERDLKLLHEVETARRQAEEQEKAGEWEIIPGLTILRSRSVIVLPMTRDAWPELSAKIMKAAEENNEKHGVRKINVLHISDKLKGDTLIKKSEVGTKHYVEVTMNKAIDSASSAKNFDRVMSQWLRILNKERVDVIIIDDILPLRNPASTWQSPVRVAEEAHRVIRKWADEQGAAIVACLPLKESELEEHGDALSHLGQFVQLIQVPIMEKDCDEQCSEEAVGSASEDAGGCGCECAPAGGDDSACCS